MIEIKNLSFGYKKSEKVFRNLALHIESGGICGLLGKNGSGKTTLLRLIAGLIFPDEGSNKVMGKIPSQRQPSFLEEIYFLSEDLYVPPVTTDDYIKYYAKFYPRFDLTIFHDCLQEFDLASHKLLTHFSHGQKKKFLIAFGLATRCRLLLLDEPTNGLDIPSKAQFKKLLASIVTEDNLIIISTHQVHDVENLIDSILILDEGKIIFKQSLFAIAKHLAFTLQKIEPDMDACIYSEKQLGGYLTVTINNSDQEGSVDLEVLFNAILANKIKMQNIFDEVQS